jgi:aminoglycoside/choline kinase family phosphotransferase
MTVIEQNLVLLYQSLSGKEPWSVTPLPGSGSYRSYYRLMGAGGAVIGAHNEDIRENEAFFAFTKQFRQQGLPVPEILASDPENRIYLLTDLGDVTLFQLLTRKRTGEGGERKNPKGGLPAEVMEVYKKALGWLPYFQVKAGRSLDYSVCYPRAAFDRQSMMWDLNYFKYYFLKLARVPFDEQALENDFSGLCDLLLGAEADFFLFRDFQSRNIMVFNDEPWFIDYQGGRKGALQYDVASLLYDGKANIPVEVRSELLNYYLDKLAEIHPVDREKFLRIYHGFVLIRILQALGAYGFRGYYEQKLHFLQSIPFALRNLRYLRENRLIDFGLDTLMNVIDQMIENVDLYNQQLIEVAEYNMHQNNELKKIDSSLSGVAGLTVAINSFSYKKALPIDTTGNGGGFIFDCRALPNPGRFAEYKQVNGMDQPVIDYLSKEPSVQEFLDHACALVEQSVKTYLDRKFNHLMVSFGCTGGQHRSVYCAEQLAKYLKSRYDIVISLNHIEQNIQSISTPAP